MYPPFREKRGYSDGKARVSAADALLHSLF